MRECGVFMERHERDKAHLSANKIFETVYLLDKPQ